MYLARRPRQPCGLCWTFATLFSHSSTHSSITLTLPLTLLPGPSSWSMSPPLTFLILTSSSSAVEYKQNSYLLSLFAFNLPFCSQVPHWSQLPDDWPAVPVGEFASHQPGFRRRDGWSGHIPPKRHLVQSAQRELAHSLSWTGKREHICGILQKDKALVVTTYHFCSFKGQSFYSLGQYVHLPAPLDAINIHVREGHIVPQQVGVCWRTLQNASAASEVLQPEGVFFFWNMVFSLIFLSLCRSRPWQQQPLAKTLSSWRWRCQQAAGPGVTCSGMTETVCTPLKHRIILMLSSLLAR